MKKKPIVVLMAVVVIILVVFGFLLLWKGLRKSNPKLLGSLIEKGRATTLLP